VYEAQVSLAQPDFTAECIQAQRNGATGIQSAVDGPSIARLSKSCAQQGYKPQYMGISLAIIDSISKEPTLEGLMAAGAVALILGWVGVSGEAFPAKQLPYLISGGIAGVFILGLGTLCWLSADLRDEWTKLDRIEDALNRLADTGLVDLKASEER